MPAWKKTSGSKCFVQKVSLQENLTFYGYNNKKITFLKLELNDWALRKLLAEYAYENHICGMYMQPCESHIDYDLKFMIDFNLRGMDWIKFKNFKLLNLQDSNKVFPSLIRYSYKLNG